MNQLQFISKYSNENSEHFNENLFKRNEMLIIDYIERMILSAQRDNYFVLKVKDFKVITDYREIMRILHNEESDANRKNKRIKYNKFDYIDLKSSDVIILQIDYFIQVDDKSKDVRSYLSIPKIVNKYYFRISGCYYLAMYQIVDGSTYNNSGTKKKEGISLRTNNMKMSVYINSFKMTSIKGEEFEATLYLSSINKTMFPLFKYFLAKFGLYGTIEFLKLRDIYITSNPLNRDDFVEFKRADLYISAPRMLWENIPVLQSLIVTIFMGIPKNSLSKYKNDIFNPNFWKENLGFEFKSREASKGNAVLDSLEHYYDEVTKTGLRLPEEDKKDVYTVLRWISYQFSSLMNKDNTDMSIKRIRMEEYIAALFNTKLNTNIFRVANPNSRININKVASAIDIKHDFLINAIKNCNLVPFNNNVNDFDSIMALRYTFKGLSGIGEKKTSAVKDNYRHVNSSHIGRVDMNDSSNTDPGMSGTLCPYLETTEDGYFSEYSEPNTWKEMNNELMIQYKQLRNRKEVYEAVQDIIGEDNSSKIVSINNDLSTIANTLSMSDPNLYYDDNISIPLDSSGIITLDKGDIE